MVLTLLWPRHWEWPLPSAVYQHDTLTQAILMTNIPQKHLAKTPSLTRGGPVQ